MAISVVYIIKKKGTSEDHDIIVHSDQYWLNSGSYYVTGGVRAEIEKTYPASEYDIRVEFVTHQGNQPDA